MIYERMLSEHNRLENQICSIQNQLKKLPPGKLICSHTENRCKWYHSDGHQKTYIPKSQQQLAEKLAIKKYLSLSLEDMEHEKKAIQFYLNHHNPSRKAEQLLTQPSGYQNDPHKPKVDSIGDRSNPIDNIKRGQVLARPLINSFYYSTSSKESSFIASSYF